MKNIFNARIVVAALVLIGAGTLVAACNDGKDKPIDAAGCTLVLSFDPNDVIGPAGKGAARYVSRGERLEYTIDFENISNATASAQSIVVTLPEDPNLDWSTLELGPIAMGSSVDLGLQGKGAGFTSWGLHCDGGYDVRSMVTEKDGKLVWEMRIWDETTNDHYPEDARAGILPPNNPATHIGEGYVKYSVCVKTNAVPNSVIKAEGTIVFDCNAPIKTDPYWTNTVGLDIEIFAFADGIGYHGQWDGDAHGIDIVIVEPKEGAVIKYSETEDGTYSTTPVKYSEVGTNTVFFTIEKDGYVPYSGSAKVVIDPNDGSPIPLEPGEDSRLYETEEAATNELKRLYVAFPADLAAYASSEQKSYYTSLFHIVTRKFGSQWRNVVEFTPEATTTLKKTLDDALKTFDLSKITTEDTNWVVPNPVMGLYYALERTTDLRAGFKTHAWDIGNSVSVTFKVNESGNTANCAFYRLSISACPPGE